MRILVAYICLLTVCFVCSANEITIYPQFSVGDTLRYKTTAQVVMYHDQDSLHSTARMLTEIIVDERNDEGFVITTKNNCESFDIECSDPESKGILPEDINDFVVNKELRIQLGADCRPKSILNISEVKETMLNAFTNMFAKEQGIDIVNSEEWRMDTQPLLIAYIHTICTTEHLIDEQFNNVPYFNFIGIPLTSGLIPASMVLSEELQNRCPDINELTMEINQSDYDMESKIDAEDGLYSIKIQGANENTTVDCNLLYAGGILEHGILSVKSISENEKVCCVFMIDGI